MKKWTSILIVIASYYTADSLACVAKEYAQYKDMLKSDYNRAIMPHEYCMALRKVEEPLNAKEREQCKIESQKMLDAMIASKVKVRKCNGPVAEDEPEAKKK